MSHCRVQLAFFDTEEKFKQQLGLHELLGDSGLKVLDSFVDPSQELYAIVTEWGDMNLEQLMKSGQLRAPEIALVVHDLAAVLAKYEKHGLVEMLVQPNRIIRAGRHWKMANFSSLIAHSEWFEISLEESNRSGIYLAPEEAAALQASTDPTVMILAKPEIMMFHLGLIIVELHRCEPCFNIDQKALLFDVLSQKNLSPLWANIEDQYMTSLVEGLLCAEAKDRLSAAELIQNLSDSEDNLDEEIASNADLSANTRSLGHEASQQVFSPQRESNQELRQLQQCVSNLQSQLKDSSHQNAVAIKSLEGQIESKNTVKESSTCVVL